MVYQHNALLLGSTLIAFGPTVSLFFTICYSQATLVIVFTCCAFCCLIAIFLSSLLYAAVDAIIPGSVYGGVLIVISIVCQAGCRAVFVRYYMKVEEAIEISIQNSLRANNNSDGSVASGTGNENVNDQPAMALNDMSSALAAGTGYGFMHAVMLCGTLLASEAGDDVGTLYQDSCSDIPSVINTAMTAMMFSLLDILLMYLYFFAVRRKIDVTTDVLSYDGTISDVNFKHSSKMKKPENVIGVALIVHSLASFISMTNDIKDGCYFALPTEFGVVLLTAFYFKMFLMPSFLPEKQRILLNRYSHIE